MKNITLWFVLILIATFGVLGVIGYYLIYTSTSTVPDFTWSGLVDMAKDSISGASSKDKVYYSCAEGATVSAMYTDNSVTLVLSDGRYVILPQVVSGSGIRYERGAGTQHDIAFLSEGNNAFLTENGSTTYADCVAGAIIPTASTTTTADTSTYTDGSKTFSFSYPTIATISGGGVGYDTNWRQQATTTGLLLVSATIQKSFQPQTNFSEAKFTVGTSPSSDAVASCLTEGDGNPMTTSQVTINGTQFTRLTFSDAGAGNFYDTTSYRTVRNNQCYAIEYTIHSTNIGNYSPDQGISQFDQAKVQAMLEGIVHSFTFLQ